mmetsp:Transcript_25103/g.35954  ORF Transcript_25103/g.35954 Transcript_25103/m.35954 type:complete len:229 (-) Transcript_25103:506-1192(-)
MAQRRYSAPAPPFRFNRIIITMFLSSSCHRLPRLPFVRMLSRRVTKFRAQQLAPVKFLLQKKIVNYLSLQQQRTMVLLTTTRAGDELSVATSIDDSQEETSAGKDTETILNVTRSCIERIQKLASKRTHPIYLRVFVDAGGCSGFQYKFELEEDHLLEEEDIIIQKEGNVRIVIDPESMKLIQGSTIDFSESMIKSSFEVLNNPQSEKACGCGSSFAVKKFQANPVTH